jgi:hypothetical protein
MLAHANGKALDFARIPPPGYSETCAEQSRSNDEEHRATGIG